MTEKRNAIGLLGGTFDPIHLGHIQIADIVFQALQLESVKFIPCKDPILKPAANASAEQRLAMLQKALAEFRYFDIDTRELDRKTPSYMVETLRSIKAEQPEKALCLILGADAFAQLAKWHEWQQIPLLCHIIVVNRPEAPLVSDQALKNLLESNQVAHPDEMFAEDSGKILVIKIPDIPISSTEIRQAIQQGQAPIDNLPLEVWEYVRQAGLYRN